METPNQPNPEHDAHKERQAFDLNALTIHQIKFLNCAIEERLARLMETTSSEIEDDQLSASLQHALDALAGTDYGREVLVALATDPEHYNQELAAFSLPAFAVRDFEFAQDLLLKMLQAQGGQIEFALLVPDFLNRLTPEQREALEPRIQAIRAAR